MILNIQTGRDNPILRKKSEPVREITKKTAKLIKDMEETMILSKGVGLAAPQIGVHERVILITLGNKKILAMINPNITAVSEDTAVAEEGCLSLPGQWGKIRRSKAVTVEFMTSKGQKTVMKFKDFEAREIQHEADHLDGILFTDYVQESDVTLDDISGQAEVERI
jgi:peptide deformylase